MVRRRVFRVLHEGRWRVLRLRVARGVISDQQWRYERAPAGEEPDGGEATETGGSENVATDNLGEGLR